MDPVLSTIGFQLVLSSVILHLLVVYVLSRLPWNFTKQLSIAYAKFMTGFFAKILFHVVQRAMTGQVVKELNVAVFNELDEGPKVETLFFDNAGRPLKDE